MKNILFLGMGSIGQRHHRNLKKTDKKLNFFCIRSKNNSPQLNDNLKVLKKKLNPNLIGIKEIRWNEIKQYNIDTAFITNPTSLHVNTALKLIKNNVNLFIEKPLSNNLKNIYFLKKQLNKKKLNCEIGFQNRYHDLLIKLKKIIDKKKYGKIVKCNIEFCHYLPNHHKYEDFRISYASQKRLGGGVILCFSHELDYAQYLFGNPYKIIPINISSNKELKINVETNAIFSILYKKNLPVIFNLDFLKKKTSRHCRIQFEKAYVDLDFIKNKMFIQTNKTKIISSKLNKNSIFLELIINLKKNFIKNKNAKNPIQNSILNLETIMSIKKSLSTNRILKL